ncbi:hypothetical protein [Embleya sp. NPDC059237]|uniref:hypothetical protein n=1 Tax=Embleya sp. NPDC059237 TaxID=3346784 RepID=UPI0036999EAF
MADDRDCVCHVRQGYARVTAPRVLDVSVAHHLRKDLVSQINALPDHVVELAFDLSGTEVFDAAGAAAIGSACRHAFLLGLRSHCHTVSPELRDALACVEADVALVDR